MPKKNWLGVGLLLAPCKGEKEEVAFKFIFLKWLPIFGVDFYKSRIFAKSYIP
jgi:hypothetical protein